MLYCLIQFMLSVVLALVERLKDIETELGRQKIKEKAECQRQKR